MSAIPDNTPEATVIIPVYKTAETLTRTVESVLGQTWKNLEIVIVNDASPDGAGKTIEALCRRDARIRAVTLTENAGTFGARLRGLAAAHGKFILNLDADDTLDPGALAHLVRTAETSGADIVGFGCRELVPNAHGSFSPNGNTLDTTPFQLTGERIFDALFRAHAFSWSLCFKLIRRELFSRAAAQLPVCRCVYADDFLQFTPIAFFAEKMVMTGKIFYNYHTSIGITAHAAMTPDAFLRRADSILTALAAVRTFLEKQDVFARYASAFACREREHFEILAHFLQVLPDAEKEAALAGLTPEIADFLRNAKTGDGRVSLSARLKKILFPAESRRFFMARKLEGAWRFRKGKSFHDA